MNIPKRHHFVPRFILANFAGGDGKLWVRSLVSGSAWSATSENVYVEGHRYSTIESDGSRDGALETSYSELEGAAKPVVDKLISAARIGAPPVLDGDERAIWNEFFYHQLKRVPAMTKAVAAKEGWTERLEAVIDGLESRGIHPSPELLAELRSPAGLAAMTQNATVLALSKPPAELVQSMLNASKIEVAFTVAGKAFLIGDRPIANAAAGVASGAPLWFPIAPDVAVRPIFDPQPEGHSAVAMGANQVASINAAIAAQCDQVASCSKALLMAIAIT